MSGHDDTTRPPVAGSAGGATAVRSVGPAPALADFWTLSEAEREEVLLRGITEAHAYHFERNTAYRNTVAARGIGPWVSPAELPRLLRATSLAFKSYIDILGTPFPQDEPAGFVEWLAEQVSVDMRVDKHRFALAVPLARRPAQGDRARLLRRWAWRCSPRAARPDGRPSSPGTG